MELLSIAAARKSRGMFSPHNPATLGIVAGDITLSIRTSRTYMGVPFHFPDPEFQPMGQYDILNRGNHPPSLSARNCVL